MKLAKMICLAVPVLYFAMPIGQVAAKDETCAHLPPSAVENMITTHFDKMRGRNAAHPIASAFFASHTFHQSEFSYGIKYWLAPFSVKAYGNQPFRKYQAIIDCSGSVELSVLSEG